MKKHPEPKAKNQKPKRRKALTKAEQEQLNKESVTVELEN